MSCILSKATSGHRVTRSGDKVFGIETRPSYHQNLPVKHVEETSRYTDRMAQSQTQAFIHDLDYTLSVSASAQNLIDNSKNHC